MLPNATWRALKVEAGEVRNRESAGYVPNGYITKEVRSGNRISARDRCSRRGQNWAKGASIR